MKITDLKIEKVKLELREPFHVAFSTIEYGESLLIKVITDEGYIGYGEAAPIEMVTGDTMDTTYHVLQLLRNAVIGEDPLAIDRIHRIMDTSIVGNTAAKCAIDLALHDIKGKMAGLPVYKLLGGYSNTIQNDTTLSLDTPDRMAAEACERVNQGFHIIKVKAGRNVDEDIQAIKMIRDAVGADIHLRVDANQGYTVPIAIKALEAFAKAGVESVEQCLPSYDLEGARFLKQKGVAGLALMLDESIHSPTDAMKAISMRAADIINIKLMKCGGLYKAEQIYAIAEASGLSCMVGCMMETRLANTAGLSLASAKRAIPDADCDSYTIYKENQNAPSGGFVNKGDIITMFDKPGLGIDIDF